MAFSMKHDLDNQTKLFTALGFGDKQTTEPFLDNARAAAWTRRTDTLSLNQSGEAVVDTTIDGKPKGRETFDFSNSEVSLPKSMHYDVAEDKNDNAHIDLSADIFGGGNKFHVVADGKIIDGSCSTKNGITECKETIKDAAGHLLLNGKTVTDLAKNPEDFQRTTSYTNASNEPVGSVTQHVKFDKANDTMVADSSFSKK